MASGFEALRPHLAAAAAQLLLVLGDLAQLLGDGWSAVKMAWLGWGFHANIAKSGEVMLAGG